MTIRYATRTARPDGCSCQPFPHATFRNGVVARLELRHQCGLPARLLDLGAYLGHPAAVIHRS